MNDLPNYNNGIKELGSGDYGHRLDFDGTDKFYEISLVINEMAEKLYETEKKTTITIPIESEKTILISEIQELKSVVACIKNIETEAEALIGKLERKSIEIIIILLPFLILVNWQVMIQNRGFRQDNI